MFWVATSNTALHSAMSMSRSLVCLLFGKINVELLFPPNTLSHHNAVGKEKHFDISLWSRTTQLLCHDITQPSTTRNFPSVLQRNCDVPGESDSNLLFHPPPVQTRTSYSLITGICFHFKGLLGVIKHATSFQRYYAQLLITAVAVPIKINLTKLL